MGRVMQMAPLLYALVGAGVSLCLGMTFRSEPSYRVPLDASVPLLFAGVVAGVVVGCLILAACALRPGVVRPVGLVTVTLLGAVIAAPVGWVAGSLVTNDQLVRAGLARHTGQLPAVGMAAGAVVGCLAGAAVGVRQVLLDRLRSTS